MWRGRGPDTYSFLDIDPAGMKLPRLCSGSVADIGLEKCLLEAAGHDISVLERCVGIGEAGVLLGLPASETFPYTCPIPEGFWLCSRSLC